MNEGLTMSESVAEDRLVRYVIQFQSPHRDDWQDCAVESYATVEQMRSRAMGMRQMFVLGTRFRIVQFAGHQSTSERSIISLDDA
ncbi:MAG: hypothetical protein OXD01_02625 [Gammaproteobacteria bacterium]|nr:hypothetical protein [Gammaproteobacteria bacterium]